MIPLSRAEADVTTDAPKLESITVAIMRDARARDTLQFVLLCYLQCHFSWRKMKTNKPLKTGTLIFWPRNPTKSGHIFEVRTAYRELVL